MTNAVSYNALDADTARTVQRQAYLGHVLLFLVVGVGNGVGTVVVKIGLAGTNPIVFALLRNVFAALLMGPIALVLERRAEPMPLSPGNAPRLVACGILLFGTNFAYTLGLKLTTAVVGAAWQCSIPVLTSAYTIVLGRERFSYRKAAGFVFASAGAAVVVAGSGGDDTDGTAHLARNALLGNLCFFVNTNCLALYGICTKPLMLTHPRSALTITSCTFVVCALAMCAPLWLTAASPTLHQLVCPACVVSGTDWAVPNSAIFGLCYMIIVFSFGAYGAINWANTIIDTSKINAYISLQPMFAAVAVAILLQVGFNERHPQVQLTMPNAATAAGGVGILIGLALVLVEDFARADKSPGDGSSREERTPLTDDRDDAVSSAVTVGAVVVASGSSSTVQ